ncbi:MAG: amidase [Actinobacteria bacterium]|nr:MAG: amidase [Actinomycetota bacterium]
MATFITRMHSEGAGVRLAVKDIIDVEGVPTTAGSRALERRAAPAERDAACLAGARSAGARLVGKANLHEFAMLPIGTNPWFGTPTNPLDSTLIPGGSSSGSAVAVATDEADVALGSDTGGSVRVPAACCGVAGLKTTHGRVSLAGVWPLAPSLDTIGPLASNVAGLVLGMQLLEPGFAPSAVPARTVGRLPTSAHPALEAAIDDALRIAELEVVPLDWSDFETGTTCFSTIYFNEIPDADRELAQADPENVGADVIQTLGMVDAFRPGLEDARGKLAGWRSALLALFEEIELLALPTLPIFPPRLEDVLGDATLPAAIELTRHVSLFNAAGVPCTAQPVSVASSKLPGSIQLVGPPGGEELLLATAARLEAANASATPSG